MKTACKINIENVNINVYYLDSCGPVKEPRKIVQAKTNGKKGKKKKKTRFHDFFKRLKLSKSVKSFLPVLIFATELWNKLNPPHH
jgi:hypothetical protein